MDLKSRKLLGTTVLFVVATVILFVTDLATFEQWSSFVKWIWGIYAAGNVGEHATKAYKESKSV